MSEKPSPKAPVSDAQRNLSEERSRPSFDIREMTYLLDGGEGKTKLNEQLMREIQADPVWNMEDQHNLSLLQVREKTLARVKSTLVHIAKDGPQETSARLTLLGLLDPGFSTRLGLHFGVFMDSLRGQATPEQFQRWAKGGLINMNGLIGSFSMTELGHGSNLAGLETTATWDSTRDEFVINTPTITATKWWIGNAAHTATHSVVYAQLIVKGKRYGVHTFLVPLRDTKTYATLPGITIGDIGKKMGRDGIDNGWIRFQQVRIPRDNMLMKYTKVTRDGQVTQTPLPQLTYGALINGRVAMVRDSANFSKKALTIALRYAAARRQFSDGPGRPETKILDYLVHQNRLLPLLAQTFAIQFSSNLLDTMYTDLIAKLQKGQDMDRVIIQLKETHATSAGLKAFCTWSCVNTIEQCRQSCGGNGYSSYTGLASLYQDFVVQCTWEGDNTILTLQTGRFLISSYQDAVRGRKVSWVVDSSAASFTGADLTLEDIREAWFVVAMRAVEKANRKYETNLAGHTKHQAMEICAVERLHAARMHHYAFLYRNFVDKIYAAPDSLKSILSRLCLLYGLYSIQQNSGPFLASGYFSPDHLDLIDAEVNRLCATIRPDAIPLVDSFNYSDHIINSPLGRYDGDVYTAYFSLVERNNPTNSIPPYLDSVIQPILRARY
ncbi:acyl-coenzyme A oxidase I [Basidiobolus meristosporus CBS 931.73]|uniref:Acyl-coenzyme A oxidase n=1 Tax=Basidiobolus meristosporus CBS 931.73 TaxID=1314790 RepID=A0A1Y1Y012_9FUNG|nr:acyl-coenzyme A oxidase I [Basidiobolus meristosporus CBS 931.73]|eukprot:ORX91352.1 acyl-coenzyme A oxidase I [Basidiobolus meristosporus CBS 931.73]